MLAQRSGNNGDRPTYANTDTDVFLHVSQKSTQTVVNPDTLVPEATSSINLKANHPTDADEILFVNNTQNTAHNPYALQDDAHIVHLDVAGTQPVDTVSQSGTGLTKTADYIEVTKAGFYRIDFSAEVSTSVSDAGQDFIHLQVTDTVGNVLEAIASVPYRHFASVGLENSNPVSLFLSLIHI